MEITKFTLEIYFLIIIINHKERIFYKMSLKLGYGFCPEVNDQYEAARQKII